MYMERLNGLDLFSGIGGNTLALREWVKTVAYCDFERHSQSVLLSRMRSGDIEPAPIWDDVRTLTKEQFDVPIDIIVGGFPCQDISVAGKGAGIENGERSGLFFEIMRLVRELNPTFVFLENVPAIRTRGLDIVLQELTEAGYDCRWTMLSASSVGANHQRERWFMLGRKRTSLAYSKCQHDKSVKGSISETSNETRQQERWNGFNCSCPDVANAKRVDGDNGRYDSGQICRKRSEKTQIFGSKSDWWSVEPNVGGTSHGFSSWLDSIDSRCSKMAKRIILYADVEKIRPTEILQILLEGISKEDVQREIRGQEYISPQTILQSLLFGIQERWSEQAWLQLESEKILKDELRCVWFEQEFTRSSHKSKHKRQSREQHSDSLQDLSRLLALDSEEAWSNYRREDAKNSDLIWPYNWEYGFSRVANGVPLRVDRLKRLGNSVVPLQAQEAFKILVGLK